MSRIDWAFLVVFIIGFILFLYGANHYDAVIGYTGVYLFIGSIAAYLILYIYKEITKKSPPESRKVHRIYHLGTEDTALNLSLFQLPV
jgi:multisubunit Na+/H+ antiporter MnhB subunit